MDRLKQLYKEGRHVEALQELLVQVRTTADYSRYMSLCRLWVKLEPGLREATDGNLLRIAILGGATTDFLELPLKLELETLGLRSSVSCSDFNTFVAEMLDESSRAATFAPQVSVLLVTPHNIDEWPAVGDSPASVAALVDGVADHWLGLCDAFHRNTNSEIVLSNLHLLPTRVMGNLGTRLPWDPNSFIRQINVALSQKAPDYVHLFDVETVSAIYGVSNWFDPRFWHHAKQPVSFACLVPFVRNLASIIGALYGNTAKCLVLDLDNTLWGGVVGDDGLEGLKIGDGDAEGEAFQAFQKYILALKNRGILLAVCSKNEEANALEPFDELPEMVLKREDFVAFKANWEPKPGNIEQIAEQLNIGLDAIVFVDDNPAERELVRQALPQVKVVELSNDPADYPRLLDQCGWLEVVKLTQEDIAKTEQYRQLGQRSAAQSQHTDYNSYLASLEQKAIIRAFEPKHLDRITQLINKTNQFNLTTQRLTRSEVEALMESDDTITAYIRLTDRFGDNGLISVLSAQVQGETLHVDNWLMSCRVLKRGVERLVADYLFEKARERGLRRVSGVYRPTAKNKMVESLYRELGFASAGCSNDGEANWELPVQDYRPEPVPISILTEGDP